MKKIIGIFSILLILCLMTVNVMAESMNGGVDFTYTDNGDGTYDVALVVTADSANVAYAFGSVSFDPAVWSAANYKGVAYDLSQISSGKIALNEQAGVDKAYGKGDVVFGFTATCLDAEKMATSPITISGDTMFCDSSTSNVLYMGNDTAWDLTIAAAQKEDPTYVAVVEPKATFEGLNDTYTGIWVGAYTVALKGNTANAVTVNFDANHNYTVDTDAAGEGSIAFKIAVLGAPIDAVGTPVLDGVTAIAE